MTKTYGPANDDDPNVQIEISAARAAHSDEDWRSWQWVEEFHLGWSWDPTLPLCRQWPWRNMARLESALSTVGSDTPPPADLEQRVLAQITPHDPTGSPLDAAAHEAWRSDPPDPREALEDGLDDVLCDRVDGAS